MMDLRRLRLLAALERLGTVSAVADEAHLTASGVSMQLAALERESGVALTERRGRRLALTPAGRLVAEHARALQDRMALAEREVAALREGLAGTYTVAAFPSAARTFVADAWRDLASTRPGLQLRLVTLEPDEAVDALGRGDVDLAVVHTYSNLMSHPAPDLDERPVVDEPVWLATGPAQRSTEADADGPARLADVARLPWITAPESLACAQMVDRACGLAGFRPTVVARSLDFAAQLALVAAGVGVALVPDLTVDRVPAGVSLRPLADPVHRSTSVVTRSSLGADPGIDALRSALTDAAGAVARARGWEASAQQLRTGVGGAPQAARMPGRSSTLVTPSSRSSNRR